MTLPESLSIVEDVGTGMAKVCAELETTPAGARTEFLITIILSTTDETGMCVGNPIAF